MTYDERDDLRRRMLDQIAQGHLTPREVANALALSRVTVFLWCKAAGINYREARARYVNRTIERATAPGAPPPTSRKAIARKKAERALEQFTEAGNAITKGRPSMFTSKTRSQHGENPHKRAVLTKLKAGTLSIPAAARKAEVPISGIVGWMKLEGLPVPDKYNLPRRYKLD